MFNPIEKILVDEEHPEINDLLLKLSERTNMRQVAFTKGILCSKIEYVLFFTHCFFN